MAPFAVAGKLGSTPGHPGEPNAKAAEALTKYLIGNTFADVIKGKKAEDAVAALEGQMKAIYGADRRAVTATVRGGVSIGNAALFSSGSARRKLRRYLTTS